VTREITAETPSNSDSALEAGRVGAAFRTKDLVSLSGCG